MLWDYGTWHPEVEDIDAGLRKGVLRCVHGAGLGQDGTSKPPTCTGRTL